VVRARKHSLTPASSGKKFFLSNFFVNPSTVRYAAIIGNGEDKNPHYMAFERKGQISPPADVTESGTPTFLRRRNFFSLKESSQVNIRSNTVRMQQNVVGKGLSSLIERLRKMEDEKLDNELGGLRELEAEQPGQADVIFGESQVAVDVGSVARTDSTSKKWQKKGQKRTTRRVTIKPPRMKVKLEQEQHDGGEESEDELAVSLERHRAAFNRNKTKRREVDKSKNNEPGILHGAEPQPASASASNYESCLDPDDDSVQRQSLRMSNTAVTVLGRHISKQMFPTEQPTDSQIRAQKKERKTSNGKRIKAEAHANYRALKMPSKGSKRRGGMGIRFGRRGR
jgi:hypothetical protein